MSRMQVTTSADPPFGGLLACVIEDEPLVRLALCELLREWGFRLAEAPDGDAALTVLDELREAPEVVLADFRLGPGRADGVWAIDALRARWGGDIPAILLSGWPDGRLGSSSDLVVVPKPYGARDLRLALIRALLARDRGDAR